MFRQNLINKSTSGSQEKIKNIKTTTKNTRLNTITKIGQENRGLDREHHEWAIAQSKGNERDANKYISRKMLFFYIVFFFFDKKEKLY
jgi:hypothetical protein